MRGLDIGCGPSPKNPFQCEEIFGVDIRSGLSENIKRADLAIEAIPFPDSFFDYVTAFDFIEHVPRVLYNPNCRFPFVELMNEIYRVLVPGGHFFSFTPAFPASAAWRDPTHVNIITEETFSFYFDDRLCLARPYGFTGTFSVVDQKWDQDKIHLRTLLRKPAI